MRRVLVAMTLLAACGEKAAPPASSASASPTITLINVEIPGDSDSMAFAKLLLQTTLTNFKPTDSSGAKFVYKTMQFSNGNSWKAAAYIEMDDIQIDCEESGSWSITPAESATVAGVNWKVETTDCAGREAGGETRALMTLSKTGLTNIRFR